MYSNYEYRTTYNGDMYSRSYGLSGSTSLSQFNAGAYRSTYAPMARYVSSSNARVPPTTYTGDSYSRQQHAPPLRYIDRTAPRQQYYYSAATQQARTTPRSSSVDRYGRSTIDVLLRREPSPTTNSRYISGKYNVNYAYDGDDGYSSGNATLLRYTRRRPSQDTVPLSSPEASSTHSTHNGYVDDAEANDTIASLPVAAPGRVVRSTVSTSSSMPEAMQNGTATTTAHRSATFERRQPSRSSQGSTQSSSSSSGCVSMSESVRSFAKKRADSPSRDGQLVRQMDYMSIASTSDGLRGLNNLGNTCFMNCIVQCLSHTPQLRSSCFDGALGSEGRNGKCTLTSAFAELMHSLWKDSRDAVSPMQFRQAITKVQPRFSDYQQHDAQEFLRYLLQCLHEEINRAKSRTRRQSPVDDSLPDERKAAEAWKRMLHIDDSEIVDIFVGQLKSELRCTHCGYMSTTFDPFWDLSLPIASGRHVELKDCLSMFTSDETLDGDEMPNCDKCRTRRKSTKRMSIHRFPKVLVLHLKRFSGERFRSRLSTFVNFPVTDMDLSEFASGGTRGVYDLYAVVNHEGSSVTMGHYTAYVRHAKQSQWHIYDDSRVSPVRQPSSIVTANAYVLFYELHGEKSRL